VTQRLALLAIEVGRAELAASEGPQAEAMRSVREGLVRLSEDIHSLAYQLHPSVLEELGLAEALRAECERLGRRCRVDLSVELDPLPEFLGRDAALCLFRVAQEALNNLSRHAGAHAANLTLRQMDGGLLLAVRDDGVGFDPASPGTGMSLGMASMRERVRLVNGTLDIESAAGQGTTVIAWVPRRRGDDPTRRPRVLLADDHVVVAEALKSLLAPEFDLVAVVADGRALVEAAGKLRPDVIVADITMPHLNGIDALIQLRRGGDRVPVVFLTMHRDVTFARRALDAGAAGFVLKHSAPAELVTAIRAALEGKTYLTPQLAGEVLDAMKQGRGGPATRSRPHAAAAEVLQLLAEGRSAKEIAAKLEISTRTVEFHKYQMMETLGLHTNAELIHFAIKHGLVEL
jgi:DNA-binding NarL/FixJ family response regulator/two-component sensor histidine kinase